MLLCISVSGFRNFIFGLEHVSLWSGLQSFHPAQSNFMFGAGGVLGVLFIVSIISNPWRGLSFNWFILHLRSSNHNQSSAKLCRCCHSC